jgi:hypothetical protein
MLAVLALGLCFVREVKAQEWEKIGWEGGGQVEIKAQLGNTLYGIANYSVYKSTDWGKTWVMFHDGLPNYTNFFPKFHQLKNYLVTDTYYPTYSQRNYPTFGFYYCQEGDKKWTFKKINTNLPCATNESIRVFFFSGDSIIVFGGCDYNQGYYFSSDGGNSWIQRMSDKIKFNFNQRNSSFQFSANSILLLTYAEIYSYWIRNASTKDFGLTWDSASVPLREYRRSANYNEFECGMPFVLKDSIILQYYSYHSDTATMVKPTSSGLFRSPDLCQSWEKGDFGGEDPYFGLENHNIIKSIGEKTFAFTGFQIGGLGLQYGYISDDLGKRWSRVSALDSSRVILDFFGKENYYILSIAEVNGVNKNYFSTDSTFKVLTPLLASVNGIMANSRTLVGVQGTELFALPDSTNKFYDSLMISTDNGNSWNKQLFFGHNKLYAHKWVIDQNQIYASGIQEDSLPCIFRTKDRGVTWDILSKFNSKDSIRKFFVQRDTLVVIRQKDFLISIDRGKSWIVHSFPEINNGLDIAYGNGMFIITKESYDNILTCTDLGNSWQTESYFGISPFVFGARLFFFNYYHDHNLYFKKRNEKQWISCSGLSNDYPIFLHTTEGSVMYAFGNFEGYREVYASFDSGSTWQQLGNYVTNSTDVFSGSEYIFLAGPNELWRMPKSVLNTLKAPEPKNISTLSISCTPNPASASTRISYSLPTRSDVLLQAFDLMGREMQRITNGAQDAGVHDVVWDTQALPSGSYIIRLSANGESTVRVVEVVK